MSKDNWPDPEIRGMDLPGGIDTMGPKTQEFLQMIEDDIEDIEDIIEALIGYMSEAQVAELMRLNNFTHPYYNTKSIKYVNPFDMAHLEENNLMKGD